MGKDEAPSLPTDLAAIVQANSEYFDKLVNLVHPEVYLPKDDAIERPWQGGMNKQEKMLARKQTRANLKKARRDRLDPKNFATTTELQKQREKPAKEETPTEDGKPVVRTRQELQERLRKRIEEVRAVRNAEVAQKKAKIAKDWRKNAASKKRKEPDSTQQQNTQQENTDTPNKKRKTGSSSENEMEFGRVKIDSQKRAPKKKSKEKLLQQATKLQADMQDGEKGKMVAAKHAWDAAVSRAAGDKVFDNPKLLKQSIKKDQQRREKSAHKWQERNDAQKQKSQERQQNRSSHIKERLTARKERAISKREKKLLRPGFEGRKAGFINEKSEYGQSTQTNCSYNI